MTYFTRICEHLKVVLPSQDVLIVLTIKTTGFLTKVDCCLNIVCGLMMFVYIICTLCISRVTTIYPVQDQNALQDRRVMSLIQYAKKVEKSMFEAARNRVVADLALVELKDT